MTKNASYPLPSPTLAVITAATNDLITAIANAANGGKALTLIKNAKRAALVALLRQLANYVAVACKGNLAVLLSSGFPAQKSTQTRVGVLPAPSAPVLRLGERSGELLAVTKKNANAATYNWRVALVSAPTVYIQKLQSTGARKLFTGLTPGLAYIIDVNAVGSAGPSTWSDTATSIVL